MSWWTKKGRRIAIGTGIAAGAILSGGLAGAAAAGAGAGGLLGMSAATTGMVGGALLGGAQALQNDQQYTDQRDALRQQEKDAARAEAIENSKPVAIQMNNENLISKLLKRNASGGTKSTIRTEQKFGDGVRMA